MALTEMEPNATEESHDDQESGHTDCSDHDTHRGRSTEEYEKKRTSPTFPTLPPLQPEQVVVGLRTSSPVRSPTRSSVDPTTSRTKFVNPESQADLQQNDVSQITLPAHIMETEQEELDSDGRTTSHPDTMSTTTSHQTTTATACLPVSDPTVSQSQTRTPSQRPSTSISNLSSSSPIDFLTLIASQERRVLELRDDLHRAETELEMLKKRWAVGEAKRKNAEIRRAAMRTRRVSGGVNGRGRGRGAEADPAAQEDRQKMMERRRSLMVRPTRATTSGSLGGGAQSSHISAGAPGTDNKITRQQRLFSGGRHARTLSLLATPATRKTSGESSRHSQDQLRDGHGVQVASIEGRGVMGSAESQTNNIRRSSQESSSDNNTSNQPLNKASHPNNQSNNRGSMPPVPPGAEIWVRQGQKVAEGLKEGLWSLFEDIRQATVGEEGISGPDPAVNESTMSTSARPSQERRPGDRDHTQESATTPKQSFWSQFGVDTPGKPTAVDGRAKANGARGPKNIPLRDTTAQTITSAARQPVATPARTPRISTRPRAAVMATVTDLLVDLGSDGPAPSAIDDEEVEAEGEWEAWESPVPSKGGKGFNHDERQDGMAGEGRTVALGSRS